MDRAPNNLPASRNAVLTGTGGEHTPRPLACSARGTNPGRLLQGSEWARARRRVHRAPLVKRAAKIDEYVEEYLNGRSPTAPPPEPPITSQVDGELRELRVRFANVRYRVLYQRSGNLIVLLHAIEKHTGAIPQADVDLAKQRMVDFARRMDAERRVRPRAAGQDAPPSSR